MTWVAVGVGVAGAAGSLLSASKQKGGADQAAQTQAGMFHETRALLNPYSEVGRYGTIGLGQLLGINAGFGTSGPSFGINQGAPLLHQFGLQDFQASPAYQFNLQQGQQAIDKSAAARGNLYAPQTLQDIAKYSQGLASNEFQNAFSNYNTGQENIYRRLMGINSLGENASAGIGNAGMQAGQYIGNAQMGGANAQAAGIMGATNALAGGVGNAYNNYLQNQILQQNQQSIFGGGGGYGGGFGP